METSAVPDELRFPYRVHFYDESWQSMDDGAVH